MDNVTGIPRVVIAGVASGTGKTTTTVGLISALRAQGLKVVAFKCGPDYLDPTYHERAAGIKSHNLDGWMMGRDAVVSTFEQASRHADIAIIEGVMGLFDGASPTGEEGSTAEIAKWLSAPVLLTIDASGMARTVAAIAHGFSSFDPDLKIAGLVCNFVGSRGHLELLSKAAGKAPVLGGFPKRPDVAFPERHLGLHTASKDAVPENIFNIWGGLTSEWFDLTKILAIARSAPSISISKGEKSEVRQPEKCKIGIAFDDAFHFYYQDNLQRLEACGAGLVRFSPIRDKVLPQVDGLYFGGGYPEVFARELSQNTDMLNAVRCFAGRGGAVYGECGGLMYLASGIRTLDAQVHPMVNLLPIEITMTAKLQALGYVEVETQSQSLLGPAGLRFRGHQFRYSEPHEIGDIEKVYSVRKRRTGIVEGEGYRVKNVLASYVHAHWASNPLAAECFVRGCSEWSGRH